MIARLDHAARSYPEARRMASRRDDYRDHLGAAASKTPRAVREIWHDPDRDAADADDVGRQVKGRHTVGGDENTETGSEQWPGEQENELTNRRQRLPAEIPGAGKSYQSVVKGDLNPDGIDRISDDGLDAWQVRGQKQQQKAEHDNQHRRDPRRAIGSMQPRIALVKRVVSAHGKHSARKLQDRGFQRADCA